MKCITITIKQFKSALQALQQQRIHDNECTKAIARVFPADHLICGYDNHYVAEALVTMLKQATDDDNRHSWIDYYIDELDFGRAWKERSITIDNKPVRLQTVDDLWDLLTMEEEDAVDYSLPRGVQNHEL